MAGRRVTPEEGRGTVLSPGDLEKKLAQFFLSGDLRVLHDPSKPFGFSIVNTYPLPGLDQGSVTAFEKAVETDAFHRNRIAIILWELIGRGDKEKLLELLCEERIAAGASSKAAGFDRPTRAIPEKEMLLRRLLPLLSTVVEAELAQYALKSLKGEVTPSAPAALQADFAAQLDEAAKAAGEIAQRDPKAVEKLESAFAMSLRELLEIASNPEHPKSAEVLELLRSELPNAFNTLLDAALAQKPPAKK